MEDQPLEFVPLAVRDLMKNDVALGALLGAGDAMRVYPVEAGDEADLPYVIYHQLEEQFTTSKDGNVSEDWALMVTIHALDPGAYMTASRICRLTRRALDRKASDVLDDAGDTFRLRLKCTGQEDITPEDQKNIISIALTFRGTKIS